MEHWASGAPYGDVCPTTRYQRDWVHKTANFLDALPKSAQPRVAIISTTVLLWNVF
jgi:transposase-like protein